jgi:hypothetical protein
MALFASGANFDDHAVPHRARFFNRQRICDGQIPSERPEDTQ